MLWKSGIGASFWHSPDRAPWGRYMDSCKALGHLASSKRFGRWLPSAAGGERDIDPGAWADFSKSGLMGLCSRGGRWPSYKMQRRACRQRVDQRATGHLAGVAALHSIRQHTRHCPKIDNLCANVRQMTRCNPTHLAAGVVAIRGGKG